MGKEIPIPYLTRVAVLGGLITGAIGVPLIIAPEFWVRLLLGDQYVGYAYILPWYVIGYFGLLLLVPLRAAFAALEYGRPMFKSKLWMAAVAATTSVPLILAFAFQGAAASLMASSFVVVFVLGKDLAPQLRARSEREFSITQADSVQQRRTA